jgi:hypothetical protein
VIGHEGHQVLDARLRLAGDHVGRHHVAHGLVEGGRAAVGDGAHDVALGDDPRHGGGVVVGHDDRTDPVLAQRGDHVGDGGAGRDGDDIATLGGEQVLDQHVRSPLLR